jgi:hypothetical protein
LQAALPAMVSTPRPADGGPVPIADAAEEAAGADAIPLQDDMPPLWPDEAAETAFLSEAKARGEVAVPMSADATEETPEATAPLPALDALVQRIPPAVREVMDDLFRAKFVRVQRVPRKALRT